MNDSDFCANLNPERIRKYLLEGKVPRDMGGTDALASRPPPLGNYLSPFLQGVHANAQALADSVIRHAEVELLDDASNVRGNPYVLQSAPQRIRSAKDGVAARIEAHIVGNTSQIMAQRAGAEVSKLNYRHMRQRLGISHLTLVWDDLWTAFSKAMAVAVVEVFAGVGCLIQALGTQRAIITAIGLALTSLAGGVVSALAVLRPADRQVSRFVRVGQWALSVGAAGLTGLALDLGACMRSVWIDGHDGSSTELKAKLLSPVEVLLNPEVGFLLILGLVGYMLAARAYYIFFNGYRSPLRRNAMDADKADQFLWETVETHRRFFGGAAQIGFVALSKISDESGAWLKADAGLRDEAKASCLNANRAVDMVCREFARIVAEYREAFFEIRPAGCISDLALPCIGSELELPGVFIDGRGEAIATATGVSDQVRRAQLEIAEMVNRAVIRVDVLAGLRPPPPSSNLLLGCAS